MDTLQHELVTQWARAKFGLPADVKVVVEQEIQYYGYCDTCAYERENWVVYDVTNKPRVELHRFDDDLASMLREIMDYAATGASK